jgi:hypothetical protein
MGGKGSGTIDTEIIRLDGTKIDSLGNKEKSNFFDFLKIPLDDYSDVELTPEQAIKFRNTIVRMQVGMSAAMPMACGGHERCPHGKKCPLDKPPISKICPVETNLIQSWTKRYIEDVGVDPSSITQMTLVNRLVELDLLDYRANMGLSGQRDEEAPTLLKTTITETDQSTTETVNIHPLLDAKSKFHIERMKILETLVATPREKYKKAQAIGSADTQDQAKHMAEMQQLIQVLKGQAKTNTTANRLKEIQQDSKMLREKMEKEEEVLADWEEDDF